LSAAAPAITSVIAEPFAILNPQDAEQLGVEEKEILQLAVAHYRYLVKVRISPSITVGTLGVPVGFPALDGITTARHAQLQRIEDEIMQENGGDQ
jgi:anaerobic selenocysteine-containing dehydrogenase